MSIKLDGNSNESYRKDVKFTINLCRILALILGLWPFNSHDFSFKKVIKFFLNICACFLMVCAILSNVLSALYEMKEVREKIEIAGPTNFYIMSLSKFVAKCFKYIEEDWQIAADQKHREVMLKNAHYTVKNRTPTLHRKIENYIQ
ncbi:uncharacterized protein LOC122512162 [Leptopilina heterotoma]|uniref:uncharacterized protein LOC122512162 n=1 Tax=Leptopilina heterotoma TaxID=63436 RepID=UPI001CA9F5A9|nr:uncharacterized protein LOC122512162 [Leptopilina heterotoma]